jgi:hypothetical protein
MMTDTDCDSSLSEDDIDFSMRSVHKSQRIYNNPNYGSTLPTSQQTSASHTSSSSQTLPATTSDFSDLLSDSPKTLKQTRKYHKLRRLLGKNLADLITLGKFANNGGNSREDYDSFKLAMQHATMQHKKDSLRVTIAEETSRIRESLVDAKLNDAADIARRKALFETIERERVGVALQRTQSGTCIGMKGGDDV